MRRKLRLEWLSPETLKPNPMNWREHPEKQKMLLSAMMREVDWAGALLLNERTGNLLDGHARRKLAIESREDVVPVLIGEWTEEEELKILATLDPIAEMAKRNEDLYRELSVGIQPGKNDLMTWVDSMIAELSKGKETGGSSTSALQQGLDLFSTLTHRPTWNKIRTIRFLSIRKWPAGQKKECIAELRAQKSSCEGGFVQRVAHEMADAITQTFCGVDHVGAIATAPPSSGQNSVHFASMVAQAIGEQFGGYRKVFESRERKIKPRSKHFGDRTDPIIQADAINGICILVDDVVTTGNTLEQCIKALSPCCMVIPVAWIYEEASEP